MAHRRLRGGRAVRSVLFAGAPALEPKGPGRARARGPRASTGTLRTLEKDIRRFIAIVHSEELCRTHSHRVFLDRLLVSVGTTAIERELDRELEPIVLLRDRQERSDGQKADSRRNFLLAILAAFGLFNLSSAFAVVDVGYPGGLVGNTAILVEIIVQVVVVLPFLIYLAVAGVARLAAAMKKRAAATMRGRDPNDPGPTLRRS